MIARATCVLITLLLLLAGCAPAPVPYPERLVFPPLDFDFPEVEKRTLATGDTLYLRPDNELPLVELTMMVPGGWIDDPDGQEGFASLMTAALRGGGTAKLSASEFDQTLEQMAAEVAVLSGTYALTIRVSLRAKDLDRGVDLLGQLLRQPGYESTRLETVRNQMMEGVRRQNDNPGSVAERLLKEAVYGSHPLGRTSSLKSLASIQRNQLLQRHRQQFQPGSFLIGVSGDFDTEQLTASLNRMLGTWPDTSITFSPTIPPLEAGLSAGIRTVQKPLPQTTILIGDLGIEKTNPDLQAVRVMNYILGGGGFNSYLMREIRSNRGLAYSTYSYFSVGRRLPGMFVAGAETKTSSTLEVVGLIEQLIQQIKDNQVGEKELALAKDSLINSFIFAFEGRHSVVEQKMRLDFFGYPEDYMQTYRVKVAQVTAEDVQRMAQKYLQPDRMQLVLVGDVNRLDSELKTLGRPITRVDLTEGDGETAQ